MKRIWNTIIEAGVRPDMPYRRARFIRACNGIAFVTGVWLLSLLPVLIPYMPAIRRLFISTSVGAAIEFSIPLLNAAGFYPLSAFYLLLTSFAIVTFNSLQVGQEAWNDLFLLGGILVSFYYIDSLYALIATTTIGLSLFAGIEAWYALGKRGLLEGHVQPEFFVTAKGASVYSLVCLTVGFAYYNRAILNATQRALDREAARSENLLLNILPTAIADRLKKNPDVIADPVPEASIVFADLVGFTEMSRKMDAAHLVRMLNEIFIGFDRAAKRLGLEKIKTIGDAYMVAAGVPEPRPDHAQAALEMAITMQAHMTTLGSTHPGLLLRIGIHTGPVVAGVIGENKFSYDLWGDNVNIASRMESHGMPGRIHVSEAFVRAARGEWQFEPRGLIDVKGQGPMQTYFLSRDADLVSSGISTFGSTSTR